MKLRIEKTIDFWMSPDSQTWTYSTVKGVSDPVTKFKIILTIIEVIHNKEGTKTEYELFREYKLDRKFWGGRPILGAPGPDALIL